MYLYNDHLWGHTNTALAAKTITHITRMLTIKQLDTLQEECAKIAASVKTTIIKEGMQYGHLVLAIGQDEYCTETGLSTYVHIDPVDPGGYCIKITNKTMDMERAKLEGEHKRAQKDFQVFLGVQEALRDTIAGAVEYQHIAALNRKYTGQNQVHKLWQNGFPQARVMLWIERKQGQVPPILEIMQMMQREVMDSY